MRSALMALVAVAVPATAQASLVGVASFDPFNASDLYSIDETTGAATLIGSTGVAGITGIAFDGARLFAYTNRSDLYRINPLTGAATLIASADAAIAEGDLAFTGSGALWATSGAALGTVSAYAEFNSVGNATDGSGLPLDLSGLTMVDGTFYGVASKASFGGANFDEFYALDASTGAATFVGFTGTLSTVGGLDSNGTDLFFSDGGSLYTIDVASGNASLLGAHGVTGFSGIAFIPAPSSAAALLMLAVANRRRR